MKSFKRWLAAGLAAVLAASVSLSPGLAVPAAEPFADFRIDASDMDTADRTLSVDWYRPDGSGGWLPADIAADYDVTLDCKVNRVTGDATFYIQSNVEGASVTLDYLTDVNGDGMYELPEGGGDSLSAQGGLTRDGAGTLIAGQTYILSAETLFRRFDEEVRSRAQDWGAEYGRLTFPLCRVTISRTDPGDGERYEQLYYLEIFEGMLLPGDVLRSDPCREAIEYGLAQGWFAGMEDGRFGPNEPLNRAQLAQVLWTVGGSPGAADAGFSDVSPEDWFCRAVSWCRQEGLISGYDGDIFAPNAPLTREQLTSILYRYARRAGVSLRSGADLSRYDDQAEVSPWAWDSVLWAVTNRLLPITDNALRPGDTVTRAELAAALYAYDVNLRSRALW